MKTMKYTLALLMIIFLGVVTINAQSARRGNSFEKSKGTTATKTHTNKRSLNKAQTTHSNRQVQKPKVQKQRAMQPARKVQKPNVQKQRAMQPARKVQKQRAMQPARKSGNRDVHKDTRRESISTAHNPRSNYRRAQTKVYADNNRMANHRVDKYSNRQYYGGKHYHYVYPRKRVKLHYHHDTYVHNYRVLYYPSHTYIYWTRNMYRDYRRWYPHYTHWRYNYGHRIQTISAFDAKYNLGEVAMIYGRVYATWHNKETDDYLLFFGGDYPNQQFTVVVPGQVARRFSWTPERYFLGEHLTVTGLITTFDGNPEVIVKNRRQLGLY